MRIYSIYFTGCEFKRTTQIEIAYTKIRYGDGLSANIIDIFLMPQNNLGKAKRWIHQMAARSSNKMLSGFGTKPTEVRSFLLALIQIEKHHSQKDV